MNTQIKASSVVQGNRCKIIVALLFITLLEVNVMMTLVVLSTAHRELIDGKKELGVISNSKAAEFAMDGLIDEAYHGIFRITTLIVLIWILCETVKQINVKLIMAITLIMSMLSAFLCWIQYTFVRSYD